MNERDVSEKTSHEKQEQTDKQRSFMTDGETIGICLILAVKMTRTGKGTFVVKAYEENDIDPNTGKLYPNDQVRMIVEGQEDFSAYHKALEKVLDKRKIYLESFGEFYAGLAASEEIDEQVDYFRLGIGN